LEGLILLRTSHLPEDDRSEICVSSPKNFYIDTYSTLSIDGGTPYIKNDSLIKQCLKKEKIIKQKSDEHSRMLFPIFSGKEIECIIDIHGFIPTTDLQHIIEAIVNIYSNFLSVLHDNEHDTLTGLLNRKSFDHKFATQLNNLSNESHFDLPDDIEQRKTHNENQAWLAILDIDHFKKINDGFGHIYGDEVLLLFSNLLKSTFRRDDLIFRFGGEEFIVIVNNPTNQNSFNIFERFRKKVQDFEFPQIGKITVSIGIVKIDNLTPPITLIEKADQALYFAKDNGRNQTQSYHELIDSGDIKDKETTDDIELF